MTRRVTAQRREASLTTSSTVGKLAEVEGGAMWATRRMGFAHPIFTAHRSQIYFKKTMVGTGNGACNAIIVFSQWERYTLS